MTHKYFILNDIDRPYPRLVAQKIGDRLYYMNKELFPLYKQGFEGKEATPVEYFGFKITEVGNRVHFTKTQPSLATYRDKRPREWQGPTEFILEKLSTKEIPDVSI